MSKVKILFFTNNLNRTGAEVVLYNLITRLNPDFFEIGIACTSSLGELVPELPKHIKCHFINSYYSLIDKVRNQFGADPLLDRITKIQRENNYTIWYTNTLNTAFVLKYAPLFHVKTITHIHELASNYSYLSKDIFSLILQSDMIVACSELVYSEIHPVYSGNLKIIKSAIDTDYLDSIEFTNFNYAKGLITFVCSGSVSDRKGTDLFLQIANSFRKSNYQFLWLGKFAENGYSEWVKKWSDNLGLTNLKFISPTNQIEYYSLLKSADIYLSTSREESLGLSMMEAIYLKKPIIALNSGGSKLLVDDSYGVVIDSQDLNQIILEMNLFLENKLHKIEMKNSIKRLNEYNLSQEFNDWKDLLVQLSL